MEKLNSGSFGTVYCIRSPDNPDVITHVVRQSARKYKQNIIQEHKILQYLNRKDPLYFPKVLGEPFEIDDSIFLKMEFLYKDFTECVHEIPNTLKARIHIIKNVTFALKQLHHFKVVHVDLKPENIMCIPTKDPSRYHIKLIDFNGSLHRYNRDEANVNMTLTHASIEVLVDEAEDITREFKLAFFNILEMRTPITISHDIWSLGSTSYFILFETYLFDTTLSSHAHVLDIINQFLAQRYDRLTDTLSVFQIKNAKEYAKFAGLRIFFNMLKLMENRYSSTSGPLIDFLRRCFTLPPVLRATAQELHEKICSL